MNVEESLREIRAKAALVRYCASINPEIPDPDVLAGIAGACEEIESLTRAVARTLNVGALAVELRGRNGSR